MTLTLSPILRRVVSTLQNSRWGKSRHVDEVPNNGSPQEHKEERGCNVSPQDLQGPSTRSNACCKVGMTKQDLRRVLGSSAFMSFWVVLCVAGVHLIHAQLWLFPTRAISPGLTGGYYP
jgi:hypothetical protein